MDIHDPPHTDLSSTSGLNNQSSSFANKPSKPAETTTSKAQALANLIKPLGATSSTNDTAPTDNKNPKKRVTFKEDAVNLQRKEGSLPEGLINQSKHILKTVLRQLPFEKKEKSPEPTSNSTENFDFSEYDDRHHYDLEHDHQIGTTNSVSSEGLTLEEDTEAKRILQIGLNKSKCKEIKEIRELQLSSHLKVDTVIKILDSCPNLEVLDLSENNSLTRETLEKIGTLRSLKTLSFQNSEAIQNLYIRPLKNLTNLQHLNLSGCRQLNQPEALIDLLSSLKSLKTLGLGNIGSNQNMLTDEVLELLTKLPLLENLDISGAYTGTNAIEKLKACPMLRRLDISDYQDRRNKRSISALRDYTHLETLNLSFCKNVNQETFIDDIKAIKNLKFLILKRTQINHLEGLVNCPHLKNLDVSEVNLPDSTLRSLQNKGINVTYAPIAPNRFKDKEH